jgi:predicted acyltransferase
MSGKERILSIDVFRGLTMAAMILVNNPGSWEHIYVPLEHAPWNGCTPTDLIFPFFLFIVGMAIPFALGNRKEQGQKTKAIFVKILRRSALIFILGLIFYLFPKFDFANMRIPGVLQRIAIVYFFASIIFMESGWKAQRNIAVIILLGYWALMALIPVPGHGPANLEPDTNLAAWFDFSLMKGHMWTEKSDPEGLLSTLPAIATGILGMLAGQWVRHRGDQNEKVIGLLVSGALLTGLGLFWDLAFPINKNLWTSSYVVYTGGLALTVFGITYWLVDVQKSRKWITPFAAYGANCLAVYLASGFFSSALWAIPVNSSGGQMPLYTWIYENIFATWLSPINASAAFAITLILLWLIPLMALYKRKIFIKI